MPRTFTVQEANALIPRLTEVLSEMQERKRELSALREKLGVMTRVAHGNGRLSAVVRTQKEARDVAGRLNALQKEVRELGCELKGLDEGLIDFLAEREGRMVYLCWKLGEESVAYWHELETGFAGRRPL